MIRSDSSTDAWRQYVVATGGKRMGGGYGVRDGELERPGLGELVEQRELAVDDRGGPADPLPDEVGCRVAERQPHGVAAAAVGIEGGAGRVRDQLLHGTGEHRLRVHVRRQRQPD